MMRDVSRTKYVWSDEAIHSVMDGDVFALNINRGLCYGMDSVASAVWALLEQPWYIGDLCDELVQIYDVDRATAGSDVTELIAGLVAQGLVTELPDG
jgi:hypothetical protein